MDLTLLTWPAVVGIPDAVNSSAISLGDLSLWAFRAAVTAAVLAPLAGLASVGGVSRVLSSVASASVFALDFLGMGCSLNW